MFAPIAAPPKFGTDNTHANAFRIVVRHSTTSEVMLILKLIHAPDAGSQQSPAFANAAKTANNNHKKKQ